MALEEVTKATPRDPSTTLEGCHRILIIGRTGSGKTTLARELAQALNIPHVELDSLYFESDLSTVSLPVLRERTAEAISGEYWVTDGNKKAVRDLVWPRADTIVWLDYPLYISLWRLAQRALWRTSEIRKRTQTKETKSGFFKQMLSAAKGVLRALHSHRGQRKEYPVLFAKPENQHLAVLRLRSPKATQRWLSTVVGVE